MGLFDSSTLARALTGVGNLGMQNIQLEEQRKIRARQQEEDALRRQLLEGQVADRGQERGDSLQRRLALEQAIRDDKTLSPQDRAYLLSNPDAAEKHMTVRMAPRKLPTLDVNELGGALDKYGGLDPALKAMPDYELGLRGAASGRQRQTDADKRAQAAAERAAARGSGTGQITANQQRVATRNEIAGAAAQHFESLDLFGGNAKPGGPVPEQAFRAVVKTLQAQYGGTLSPNEIAGIVTKEFQAKRRGQKKATFADPLAEPVDETPIETAPEEADPEVEDLVRLMKARGGR